MKWTHIIIIGIILVALVGAFIMRENQISINLFGKEKEKVIERLEDYSSKYTPTTETHCRNGICNTVLYSGTRFVEEDEEWKYVEDAKSLKNAEGLSWLIEDDPRYNLTIEDYNYTHLTNLCFSSNETGSIPITIYRHNESNYSQIINEIQAVIPNPIPDVVRCQNISLQEPIFTYTIKWGHNSTTVQLQDADTENLEDTYAQEDTPTTTRGSSTEFDTDDYSSSENRRGYIKFNISFLPTGTTIENSTIHLYLDSSWTADVVGVYHVLNQTWDEGVLTWNNQPCGTGFDDSTNCNLTAEDSYSVPTAGGWKQWSTIQMVQRDSDAGEDNVSMVFKMEEDNSGNWYYFRSKEHATTSTRPYLNITYTINNFFDDFEHQSFVNWTNVGNLWTIEASPAIDTSSAGCLSEVGDCNMSSIAIDTSLADYLNLSFWLNDDDCEGGDAELYLKDDGGAWDYIEDIDAGTLGFDDDVWSMYTYGSTDSQYLHDDFSIMIWTQPDKNENYWVDNVSLTTFIPTYVEWNESSRDFGTSTNNVTNPFRITATGSNSNVAVDCTGDCSAITHNFTTKSMSNGETDDVLVTCNNLTSGTFSATLNVTSDEDATSNLLVIDCEVFTYGNLDVEITAPANLSGYFQNNANLTLNSSVNCSGVGDNVKCGTVYAWARYNGSGALPDTWVNTTDGGEPFFVVGSGSGDGEVYWRPVNWTGSGGSNQKNGIDKRYNDTTTYGIADYNYTYNLGDGITSGILFYTWETENPSGGTAKGDIWDFDNNLFYNFYSETSDTSPSTDFFELNSSFINSTGGVIIKFYIVDLIDHYVYDTYISTTGGGTYDYWDIENPSTTTNATKQSASTYCTTKYCGENSPTELTSEEYNQSNQSDDSAISYDGISTKDSLAFHFLIDEAEASIDSIVVSIEEWMNAGTTAIRIWNDTLWSNLSSSSKTTDDGVPAYFILNTSIANYVDSDNYIHILYESDSSHTINVDYVKVNVVAGGGGENPQSLSLNGGELFYPNWTLNISSSSDDDYFVDVFFNSSYGDISSNHTEDRLVNLNPGGAPPGDCWVDLGGGATFYPTGCSRFVTGSLFLGSLIAVFSKLISTIGVTIII